jgi:uncharacterized repeat protein (TIGR04138 family)
MHDISFEEALHRMRTKDPRYLGDAYLFVREALDYTQRSAMGPSRDRPSHVSGQQLLQGIRRFALAQYGPMALTLLQEWGIYSCRDFGQIVFNMVDVGWLTKTDSDTMADFEGGYDFYEAFRLPFLPSAKLAARDRAPNHAPA